MLKKSLLIAIVMFFSVLPLAAQQLEVGMEAPDFELKDQLSIPYKLSQFRGIAPVIIYFYPKAATPGCTKQACGIRDNYNSFIENNVYVLGISVDDKESIEKFANDNEIWFPLLSDADKKVSKAYGVLNEKGVASRVTFIIDKDRKIAKIMRDINIDTHAEDVLKYALTLK
ncbi:MAG: peroxiredoxin [Ignavibacteriaceae bacterium]|nr:peroxiredoxin [Ignavibacteriaceae bacterium]